MFCQLVNCSHTVYEHSHGTAVCVWSDRETHPFGMPLNMAALFERALFMPKERERESSWEIYYCLFDNSDFDRISLNTECRPV